MDETPEFPKTLTCQRCRRTFNPVQCFVRSDTFLGKVTLSCRGCRQQLHSLSMKDWYERYIDTPLEADIAKENL